MARKKDKTANELFKEAAKEEMRDTGMVQDVSDEQPAIIPTEELPESVKPLLASFPSADGYFGVIYRVNKFSGDWERMDYRIEAPEIISDGDLEGEAKRIIREKKWGDGDYRVLIRRQGERSIFLNKKIVVTDTPMVDKAKSEYEHPIREGIGILSDAMSVVDRLKTPQVSPAEMGNVILKAVETGQKMSAPQGGNGPDSQLVSLIEKLSPIFIPLLTKPQISEDSIVEKVVARIQTNLQPKADNLTELVKLKEGLGLKFTHESKEPKESSLDSVRKVTEIVSALRPLTGTASGEPQSTLSLVLEHLPKLVEPLLTTFKEFAEAKKMEMQLRMDQYYGGTGQPQISGGREKNLPAPRIHPFAVRIIESVNKNDESYFDMMRQQISRLYGQHVIDGLIDGNLTAELMIETVHTELGVPLNIPNLKPYFDKFIKYLQGKDELENHKGVLAECKHCHTQYDFKDMKAWEDDSKKCEDCQGDLEVVKREGEA